MRLLKLKVKNIASLKGEHMVDFGEITRQSALFAITGETGSGKSSLLNAIGLALYGQIYKRNLNQADVVTLGEKEGQIELIFYAKGRNYLSHWRAKILKQNGEPYSTPQPPLRHLYTLDGDEFESPKNITTERVEDLLNLDFDQFTKCIILNQGEFAKFLMSSFTERKEILEKLYPGEMLENLNRELKSELETFQKIKNDLDVELGSLRGDNLSGKDLQLEQKRLAIDLAKNEGWFKHIETLDYHFVSFHAYHGKFHDNQKKTELIRLDLKERTTKYNEIQAESTRLKEIMDAAKLQQEKELPKLQEFLKQEENLKNLQAMETGIAKKVESQKEFIAKDQLELTTLATKNKDWISKNEELKTKFIHPLEELQTQREKLEHLLDDLASKDIKGKESNQLGLRLEEMEGLGKKMALELKEIGLKLSSLPSDLKDKIVFLETRKKQVLAQSETKQRAEVKIDEFKKLLHNLSLEKQKTSERLAQIKTSLVSFQNDLAPLLTSLKLQEYLMAVEQCLKHPVIDEKGDCPICQSHLSPERWQDLRQSVKKMDFESLRKKTAELERQMLQMTEEEKLISKGQQGIEESILLKTRELSEQAKAAETIVPDIHLLENELAHLLKCSWDQEAWIKEESRLATELNKGREHYAKLKLELQKSQTLVDEMSARIKTITDSIAFVKNTILDEEKQNHLKTDLRLLRSFLENASLGEKLEQEKQFREKTLSNRTIDLTQLNFEAENITVKINDLKKTLSQLGGKKASQIILEITHKFKSAMEDSQRQEQVVKAQELSMKDLQSRLYTLDELGRDIDLQFARELHAIRDLGRSAPDSETEALLSLIATLSNLNLELASGPHLFIPLQDSLSKEKEYFKSRTNEVLMQFAGVKTRLEEWEKRQDKISLLEMKRNDLTAKLDRLERLFEVLGKDELRTFVLSLVEENLIEQTNEELQKLCQGRYEIFHQSRRMRMSPEFYIMDKFRDGRDRKVSTLSGGETFMVSLAMALALAEMTRGTADIDSLFIDEGFGTLDQDSLEDVLDMLKQIQNRGLMVGIISHIKALTNSLPVNLVLNKKTDGTSTVGLQYN